MSFASRGGMQDGEPIVPTVVDEEGKEQRARRSFDGICVEVIGGPMDGVRRRVTGKAFLIGRAEENDLVLSLDVSVSTRHARIRVDEGACWLEDMGSTNGTFVGEARIQGRVLLAPGSAFTVGRTNLELMPS